MKSLTPLKASTVRRLNLHRLWLMQQLLLLK